MVDLMLSEKVNQFYASNLESVKEGIRMPGVMWDEAKSPSN